MDEIGKRSIKKVFRFVGSYFKVLWNLLLNHYDACYLAITCHGIGFLKDAPFVFLCKLFNRNIIIHQHNKGMANDVNKWPYRWLLPLAYRNVTVILLSWKLYPDIEKIVKREHVVICPNGIPDLKYMPQKRHNSIPHLLFLSNLIESKGVIDLLDACKILRNKGYKFICNFVGGETKNIDARNFKKEVSKRNLNNEVFYIGKKYGIDKDKIFSESDIFIFPTYYENECFPLVLLEAMRQSLPVVTTNEGGIADIVENGETGLLSEKHSPHDLADKIMQLFDNPEKTLLMGEKGRKYFMERFTIEEFEQTIKSCINTICNDK